MKLTVWITLHLQSAEGVTSLHFRLGASKTYEATGQPFHVQHWNSHTGLRHIKATDMHDAALAMIDILHIVVVPWLEALATV